MSEPIDAEPSTGEPSQKTLKNAVAEPVSAASSSAVAPIPRKNTGMYNDPRNFALRMSSLKEFPMPSLSASLVRLELEHNDLVEVPVSVSSLHSLEYLDVSRNLITSLPSGGLDSLSSLRVLLLSCNRLTSLPLHLSALSALTHLDASKNRLLKWPEVVHTLTNLETLALGGNGAIAGDVPSSFCSTPFPRLHTLELSELGLDRAPENLHLLTSLTMLDLDVNALSEWPNSLHALSNLKRINLMLNDFDHIPESITLEHYPQLTELKLIANRIDLTNYATWSKPAPAFCRLGSINLPSNIVQGLYLGNIESCYNKHRLTELRVTHVLSIIENPPPFPTLFRYHHIEVPDLPTTDLLQHFDTGIRFIDDAIEAGNSCLVHCHAGMSRSATMVIAWIMLRKQYRRDDALDFVRSMRPIILPNDGFIAQLDTWEKELESRGVTFQAPPAENAPEPPGPRRRSSTTSSNGKCIIS